MNNYSEMKKKKKLIESDKCSIYDKKTYEKIGKMSWKMVKDGDASSEKIKYVDGSDSFLPKIKHKTMADFRKLKNLAENGDITVKFLPKLSVRICPAVSLIILFTNKSCSTIMNLAVNISDFTNLQFRKKVNYSGIIFSIMLFYSFMNILYCTSSRTNSLK